MNRILNCIFLTVSIFLLSGCIEDPDFSRDLKGTGLPVFKDGCKLIEKTASTIEVSAELLKENGTKITERGFVCSTSPNPTISNNLFVDTNQGIGEFKYKIEGLNDNTTYYIRPYAKNESGVQYGTPELTINTNIGIGSVSTVKAATSSVHAASATVGGTIVQPGEGEIIRRGVYYSLSKIFLFKDSVLSLDNTDTYTCLMENLTPLNTYYYRAFVTNHFGTFTGDVDSLTTRDGLPEIGDVSMKAQGYNDVTLGSVVVDDRDTTVRIIERGFCWATTLNPTILNDTIHAGSGLGAFEGKITNLVSGQVYNARSYAKSLYGIKYSENYTFNTKADKPTVSTEAAIIVENGKINFSARLNDKGKSDVIRLGICWSLTSINPTILNDTLILTQTLGNSYSGQLTKKLRGGQTYYYRAYATNGEGTSYGDILQLKTPAIFTTGFAPFPGSDLYQRSNAYFTIGENLYIVSGDKGANYTDEVWSYSVTTNKWSSRRAISSGAANWQTGVSFGTGAFVYGGLGEDGAPKSDFLFYDVLNNMWIPYSNCDEAGYYSVGYAAGSSVFFVGGKGVGDIVKNTVWSYSSGHWNKKTNFPVRQYGGVAVVINDTAYVGMGKDANDVCNRSLYISADGGNTWSGQAYYNPFVLGGILGGIDCKSNIYVIDESYLIHQFITGNGPDKGWRPNPTILPEEYRHFNCIFKYNNKIYIGLGGSGLTNSFIIYDPDWDY